MTILLVEDEESIAAGLKFNFEQEGYEVALGRRWAFRHLLVSSRSTPERWTSSSST